MALNKAFYGSYQSYNLTDYYFEIWIEDFDSTHGGSTFELKVGEGGPVINYDTDSEDRYNPILSSTLKMPLIITNAWYETNLLDKLYEVWQERQVYIHLYQATSSTYASTPPLWSGFVLMDLSFREDVGYPFDIEITATDGLSLLKDEDWTNVDDWLAGSPATLPYGSGDVNYGPATFDYWIRNLLRRTYMATTAEGASESWEYSSSVNWYNQGHPAIAVNTDPLKNTTGKMSWTWSFDSSGVYSVINCYDALKEVLKSWGCRLVYWNHCFYIIQIDGYTTAESGNLAAPVNIMTRRYTYAAADVGGFNYMGELQLARYELEINSNLTDGIPEGIVALKGTKYTHYPRIQEVNATLVYGGDTNYFGGFPEYVPASFTSTAGQSSSPVAQGSMIDLATATEFRVQCDLDFIHYNTTYDYLYGNIRWTIRAYNDAGSEKWLKYTSSTYSWVNTEPNTVDKKQTNNFQIPTRYQWYTTPDMINSTIPTDAAFTGVWHFEIKIRDAWASGSYNTTGFFARPSPYSASNPTWSNPWNHSKVKWRNTPNTGVTAGGGYTVSTNAAGATVYTGTLGNPFSGNIEILNSTGGQGASAIVLTNTVATTDSARYDFEELMWGDCQETTDGGNLMVTDDGGTTYVKSAFSGQWGQNTISGTTKFSQLLVQEFFSGQTENIQIFNGRLALSVNGKTTTYSGTEYLNYINPIGRLKHGTDYYVFRRGAFHTAMDEWDYEGWVIKDITNTLTTTTRDIWKTGYYGTNYGGGNNARLAAPYSLTDGMSNEQGITATAARVSGAGVTSISINEIGTAVLKNGDSFTLIDARNGNVFSLTMAADQAASDTSLTISSYDFSDYPDIESGAGIIYLNTLDLIAQYQHKTKGTIGGMAVTATSIGKATSVGRQTVFFRFEGDNLSETTYYVSNGEDNNKAGRWGSTNTNAPSTIGTQRAIKSGRFVADVDYKMEGGKCVASGTTGYTVTIILYKTTPVDGATAATAMTAMGRFTVALNTDSRTQVDILEHISTDTISANDVIIPHIYCGGEAGGTFDLRGVISFTLIRS